MKDIRAIRGMHDILPRESNYWTALENKLFRVARQYGYQEIRFPVVEYAELFSRSIGENTDIVEKEMYLFTDRSGDRLALRPEGTACCIRAGIEHGLFYNQIQRLFYHGPMFRHERPQRGRYRQFHQFGIEAYGFMGPDIDLELMLLAQKMWQDLGVDHEVVLQINTLGNIESRLKYRQCLVEYFQRNYDVLDEDSQRRLQSNPLRILDSKNPSLREVINAAPRLFSYLDETAQRHFDKLINMLEQAGIAYVINPNLVRGLDYYNLTVFEWVIREQNGLAQNAVCAGGHYDTLVADMGGKAIPAIGFAIGMERLMLLVAKELLTVKAKVVYLVALGEQAIVTAMHIADRIRTSGDTVVLVNCNGGNLGVQLKRADRSEADIALILGTEELAKGEIMIKYLRDDRPQLSVKIDNIIDFI